MTDEKKVIYENLDSDGNVRTETPFGVVEKFKSLSDFAKKASNISGKTDEQTTLVGPTITQTTNEKSKEDSKPKLLYVITKANWGGAQKYVYDLAVHNKESYNVSVAFGKNEFRGKNVFKENLEAAGIRTIGIEDLGRDMSYTQDFASFLKLIGIIFKERPDVLHLNSSKIGGLGTLAARLLFIKRIVFTAHGLPFFEDRGKFENKLIEFGTRVTFAWAHHSILISEFEYKYISENWNISKDKISMIHNAIHPIIFEEPIARRSLLHKETKPVTQDMLENPETLWLVSVGELTGNKGYGFLLHALKALKEKGVPVVFFHFGEGSDEAFLHKETEVLGLSEVVAWKGFSDLAPSYLQSFDAFVLPSVKEGLPYILLEAGQAGLPCIASNVGGVSEIIITNKTGILTEAKNTAQLAAAIELLQQNKEKRTEYGQALQTHVQQSFSMNDMLQKTQEVYQG